MTGLNVTRRRFVVWAKISPDLEQRLGQFDTLAEAEAESRYLKENGEVGVWIEDRDQ